LHKSINVSRLTLVIRLVAGLPAVKSFQDNSIVDKPAREDFFAGLSKER